MQANTHFWLKLLKQQKNAWVPERINNAEFLILKQTSPSSKIIVFHLIKKEEKKKQQSKKIFGAHLKSIRSNNKLQGQQWCRNQKCPCQNECQSSEHLRLLPTPAAHPAVFNDTVCFSGRVTCGQSGAPHFHLSAADFFKADERDSALQTPDRTSRDVHHLCMCVRVCVCLRVCEHACVASSVNSVFF